MMMRSLPLLAVACCFCGQALAVDGLQDVYQAALQNDALIASARSEKEAGIALASQARASIYPSVSLNGSSSRNDMQAAQLNQGAPYRYNTDSYSLSFNQPLYRKYNFASYSQSESRIKGSELLFANAEQDLILRVATAYFDVLRAQDVVTLLQAQHSALDEQLSQTRRLFEAKVGTLTDLHEAQARFDQTLAQEIEASNALDVKQRSLQRIIGKRIVNLKPLTSLSLITPEPNVLEHWIEAAARQNLQVGLRRNTLQFLLLEVEKSRAGHFPTLDLVATVSKAHNPSYFLNGNQDTKALALQFNMPLYQGGQVSAKVLESISNKEKAENDLEDALRSSELETSESFLAVTSGIAKVRALEQAVKSAESSLHSTKMGREVGFRTSVDVLNAQQQLFSSKLDLSKARYDYVVNRLKLKAAVGSLGPDDVATVDQWMKD